MFYKFKCEKCGKAQEVEIAIKDYDKEKDKQKCSCGGKLKRVIEWNGIATAEGRGGLENLTEAKQYEISRK